MMPESESFRLALVLVLFVALPFSLVLGWLHGLLWP